MKVPWFGNRSQTKGLPRVVSVAMVAFVLAMMVLPLATTTGVSASDEDDKPKLKINGNTPIINIQPDPTPTPGPINLPDNVDLDVDENEPEIEIPIDLDIPVEEEEDEPQIEVPVDVDVVPDPPVIDLPDCVDTDGGEVIDLPGSLDLLEERTVRLPEGVDLSGLADSPVVAGRLGDLLGQPDVTINLPPGVDLDLEAGTVFIPECEDEEPPVIKFPPGIEIGVEDDTPVIDIPGCLDVDGGEGGILRLPEGVDLDVDNGIIRLPAGVDLDLGDDPILKLPDGVDLGDFDNGPMLRLPEGVELDLDGDEPVIKIPVCDDDPGYVTIHKYACNAGVSIQNPELETLRDACEAFEGVSFTLSPTGDVEVTDVDGLAFFSLDEPGNVTITETMPDGYIDAVVVFCGVIQGTGQFPQTLSLVDAPGGMLSLDVDAGEQVYCDWFNRAKRGKITIPTGDDVTIQVTKYECPAGFDPYTATHPDLAFNCQTLMDGVTFGVSDGAAYVDQQATSGGQVVFEGLAEGAYSIVETVPDGYGEPVVHCDSYDLNGDSPAGSYKAAVLAGNQILEVVEPGLFFCDWYNVPDDYETADEGGNVVIYKFECPYAPDLSGFDYDSTPDGCVPLPGIEFTLSYGIDAILTKTTSDAEAAVGYYGLPATTVSIGEALPPGYGDPIVTCLSAYQTESGPVQDVYAPNMTGSSFAYDLKDGEHLSCFWLNIPYEDDGSITIVKFTCAPGYDLFAQGANPEYDCPDTTDGVVFSVDAPVDGGLQGVTGVSGDGTLTFDGLPAGSYTIYEQVPDGTDSVFVLSCRSEKAKWVQGYPLSTGSDFSLDLLSGDNVVCSWYNVPEEPDYGTIEVIKYVCPTATFSDVDDCELYEGGASFHLSVWTGNGWTEATEGTTNSNGVLTWYGLDPGTYEIDEIGGTWCYATADRTDEDGNLVVVAGEETKVWVYNCGQKVVTKKPVKFPNTGTGQVADTATTPSGAHAPVSPAVEVDLSDPNTWMGVFDSRLIVPFLSAAKPAALRIDAIDVNARIETLEIVNGGLQDPTTADKVAWYKDTAKLGEVGNVVMAGHLNYWGVPEGVFFRLTDLDKGDEIAVTAQDGMVYRYKVEWVKQIPVDGDVAALVGETDVASLTLITCGGQWDNTIQEYDHRTVVRATLIIEA